MSYNQYQSHDQSLKREDQMTDVSKLHDVKADQSLGQRERVKQGGWVNVEEDEHHGSEPSTMHSLDRLDAHDKSPEKVSSIHEGMAPGNLQHDASEALHKGWEKASDTIAQGVEVVKRIIMSELPPQEGSGLPQGDLKEKAQDLSNKASEKYDEVKEKIQANLGDMKESAKESSNQATDKAQEAKDQFKQQGQELKGQAEDFANKGTQQMEQFSSQSGSTQQWQPSEQMKQTASQKLGEYKEKFNQKAQEFQGSQSQGQKSFSKDESEAIIKIEQGKEASSSNEKIHEIEDLSQQLNQKVEELKKSAHVPTGGANETIIIIQQGEQGAPAQQSQFSQGEQNLSGKINEKAQDLKQSFKQSFQPSGPQQQSQEFSGQQRPKLGKRDEQQWRYQQSQESSGQEQQERPKLGKRDEQQWRYQQQGPSGSQQGQEFSGQEQQQRPKLGKRDEQQWRYQQSEGQQNESGPSMTEQISSKAQELKEGFKQGYEKGLGHPSSESQGLGDKIKQKASEIKDTYKENLQEFSKPSQEEHPHHESEHHLTIESKSFRPSAESKHLVEEQLLHQGGQSDQGQNKQQESQQSSKAGFKPLNEAKDFAKQAINKMENLSEQATTSFNERLQGEGQDQGKGQSEQKPAETHDEFGNLRTGPPPAEMTETITYHPREIRGYEIEYVPKDEAEHQQAQPQGQQRQQKQQRKGSQNQESGSNQKEGSQSLKDRIPDKIQEGIQEARDTIQNLKEGSEQSGTHDERVPLVDRIQHGIEGVAHTIQTIRGFFKPGHGSAEQQEVTHDEVGNLRTGPPPAEMTETITYHPRDIRGYKVEYVPKNETEHQQSGSQQGQGQSQEAESEQHHYEYRRGNYLVEYTEKAHHEGESKQQGQESQEGVSGKASELSNIISQQAEVLKTKYSALGGKAQSQEKELSGKASELSNIISQQADTLKDKYSALGGKGQSEEKGQEQSQESYSEEKQGGSFVSRLIGKFTHGKEELHQKEQQAAGSIQGASQDLSKKAEAAKEKVMPASQESHSEEKQAGFVSRIMGKFSHGKGESTEETSTEQNQSVFEKIQGKFQGKEKGEEVDKQGFRKVHDGFNETVDELKHEQNQEFIEQVHLANENPFEPLATKQAQTILPSTNIDMVGGDLREITSDFKEEDQEMVDFRGEEEAGQSQHRGLMQKMKAELFSKFGRENKENVESSEK